MSRTLAAAAGLAICALAARGQDAMLEVRAVGEATPGSSIVHLEVWAHFPVADYAFAFAGFDLMAGEAGFLDIDFCRCGEVPGYVLRSDRIEDLAAMQVHFPLVGAFADPANPIHLVTARWQADSFDPRVVDVWVDSVSEFLVYPERMSPASESRIAGLLTRGARFRVLERECYADCDASGELDLFDFLCFQNLFAAADPIADCDLSGELDLFDFLCFQNDFAAGCP
ncbi:MAG: hypothetical protein ACF8R7_01970 [Phycisphaerales bacterium JB039]